MLAFKRHNISIKMNTRSCVCVCVCVCGVKNQGEFVEIVRKEKLKSLRGVCRRQ